MKGESCVKEKIPDLTARSLGSNPARGSVVWGSQKTSLLLEQESLGEIIYFL